MDAKKCDRCGKYYIPMLATAGEPTGRLGMLNDDLTVNSREVSWYDLCSDCWRELVDFKHNINLIF